MDDDLNPQQMQQRKGLSAEFLCLKTRGYKPFFRGAILKYKDGQVIRTCGRGEANKAVPSRTPQASAQAPPASVRLAAGRPMPAPRRQSLAAHPTFVLQSGVTILPEASTAQAAARAAATAVDSNARD